MIPQKYITEWSHSSPWQTYRQVEQDLVIERALVQIFSEPFLQENLAFRGGTALHKIFLRPQVRYSEDIDLVQIKEGPIKPILQAIGKQLRFLGTKRSIKQNRNMNTLVYRFQSEIPPVAKLRLKIEINTREHFTVLGYRRVRHDLKNGWFEHSGRITTFQPEELLGTKLRALFQRKKGRDLFDLYHAVLNLQPDLDEILRSYRQYMAYSVDQPPSRKEYIQNMEQKLADPDFAGDTYALLRPDAKYHQHTAYTYLKQALLESL